MNLFSGFAFSVAIYALIVACIQGDVPWEWFKK